MSAFNFQTLLRFLILNYLIEKEVVNHFVEFFILVVKAIGGSPLFWGQILKTRLYESVFHCRFNASTRVAKNLVPKYALLKLARFFTYRKCGC